MKKIIALQLALIIFFSAVSAAAPVTENGDGIEKLVDRLEDLGSVYQQKCLPSEGIKSSDLQKYYEENGLTEECWQLITEINHLETELQKHQTRLEEKLGCHNGDCKLPNQDLSLNSQLTALTKVEQNLSCTEPKKVEIEKQCPADLGCAVVSTALGVGGYVAEMFIKEQEKIKGCHLGDDSCFTQLITGFLNAVVNFFQGAWDLLKLAGKKTGEAMTGFWDWVSGAEDHSSTSQLALAKASEDPGLFDMLRKDFAGTMTKVFGAFVGALKEWMKTDILCQKWAGTPHFSKCEKPTESFDCISCKSFVNGLCAVSGTILAEVVPSFLTGGLVIAAKEGLKGAVKLAKLFKVSGGTMSAMKSSRAAKIAIEAASKVDGVLKVSRGLQIAKTTIEAALKIIRRYLLLPTRKVLKNSYAILSQAAKKGSLYIAESKAGKILVISGKTLKNTGKIIMYPINNPATAMAFKAGQRTFSKAFKVGVARVAAQSAVTSTLVKSEGAFDNLIGKIEEAKIRPDKSKDLLKLEQELLTKVGPQRERLIAEALEQSDVEFSDVIKHLYPELQYGDLAKTIPAEKILEAEKQLLAAIEKMPEGAKKNALTARYHSHVSQGPAR